MTNKGYGNIKLLKVTEPFKKVMVFSVNDTEWLCILTNDILK